MPAALHCMEYGPTKKFKATCLELGRLLGGARFGEVVLVSSTLYKLSQHSKSRKDYIFFVGRGPHCWRISRYGARVTQDVATAIFRWERYVRSKRVPVVGSERPWLEGMLLAFGASNVTTIEYGEVTSHHEQVVRLEVTPPTATCICCLKSSI